MEVKFNLWNNFCSEYFNKKLAMPLFSTNGSIVNTKKYGKDNRILLMRSEQMEALIIQEVSKVLDDFDKATNIYEGLIYMMYWFDEQQQVIPLYIGKSEKYGQKGDNLSANIRNITRDKSKFCRWGNDYAYHIGDLSAVVCPGHLDTKISPKYKNWAKRLFELYPSDNPSLKKPTYFWIYAWEKGNVGIWKDFGSTPLSALEYHLISLASNIFSDCLLNHEGVNRK
jgi:hypothetical protein